MNNLSGLFKEIYQGYFDRIKFSTSKNNQTLVIYDNWLDWPTDRTQYIILVWEE